MTEFVTKAQERLAADHARLLDPQVDYPANHFAFRSMLNSFISDGAGTLVEVGVGHGNAIPVFTAADLAVSGFDNNAELVAKSKEVATQFGQDPSQILVADIEDPLTYVSLENRGYFDALVAMGVLPHVANEEQSLLNMAALVRPGGELFVEFRNSLFSLFTFNRFTYEFIMTDLLAGVSDDVRALVSESLKEKFDVTKPNPSNSKFHNPFEVVELFDELGFEDIDVIPFHYHAAMPALESHNPTAFRRESVKLENETSRWRGYFLCSAFVIHARTPEIIED